MLRIVVIIFLLFLIYIVVKEYRKYRIQGKKQDELEDVRLRKGAVQIDQKIAKEEKAIERIEKKLKSSDESE
jgi:sensor domain CHASE-containing protein